MKNSLSLLHVSEDTVTIMLISCAVVCVCSQNCVECFPVFLVTLWFVLQWGDRFYRGIAVYACPTNVFQWLHQVRQEKVTYITDTILLLISHILMCDFFVNLWFYRLLGFYLTLVVFGTLSLLSLIGLLCGLLHKSIDVHLWRFQGQDFKCMYNFHHLLLEIQFLYAESVWNNFILRSSIVELK